MVRTPALELATAATTFDMTCLGWLHRLAGLDASA